MTSRLKALGQAGQAIWLDFLDRRILEDGTLQRLIDDDGVTGLTSNPSIFEKAIGETGAYDDRLAAAMAAGDASPGDLYERLAIGDIQAAADRFRSTWAALQGADGYVSLEVSPYLAMDTEATIAEGVRLWRAVDRPNLMIKVPGTAPGVAAIRALIGEGVNVNVTLLFGIQAYLAVAEAHMAGLEDRLGAGKEIAGVHGVASFFVSRIDGAIDKKIDARLAGADVADAQALAALRGAVAIANAKIAYQHYLQLIGTDRWKALAAAGAAPQRLLWASTGTKDPAYSDVLYVESLVGPDTVNTMPPKTMDAFRDHGEIRPSLTDDTLGARRAIETAERLGLDLNGVTADLVVDGVAQFAAAFDKLLGAVAEKRTHLLAQSLNGQTFGLPPTLTPAVQARIEQATKDGWARRLWSGDPTLWTGGDEGKWLGWLAAASGGAVDLAVLDDFSAEVAAAGYAHAVLLGMGGSSLAPEVLAKVFGPATGHPPLIVLDSTDPDQICRVEGQIELTRCLFIVSSKSGTTLESDLLCRYFFSRVESALGKGQAGSRFIAVTDPGSELETRAKALGFTRIFSGDPSIGGRYSALSNFGMVPAAVLGLNVGGVFRTAKAMALACAASAPPAANPGLALGIVLGEAAKAGRDKLTLITSPAIAPFGAWLEQLVAESTGKHGVGIIPVDGEPLGPPEVYGADRVFAHLALGGETSGQDRALQALQAAGHPVIRVTLASPAMLAQEVVRWEVAVATAGAVLAIDPFDQPDVEASKVEARKLTDTYEATGALARPPASLRLDGLALYAQGETNELETKALAPTLEAWLDALFGGVQAGGYIGLLAYLDHDERHIAKLASIRTRLRDARRAATVVGFGPRFQHSTGQAYKGGPPGGVFLQITGEPRRDVAVPGRRLSFAVVEAAQARGDLAVLAERGRRVLRLDLGADIESGLAKLQRAIEAQFPSPRRQRERSAL